MVKVILVNILKIMFIFVTDTFKNRRIKDVFYLKDINLLFLKVIGYINSIVNGHYLFMK